jgi:SAM-dependent methyltransferase
MENVAWEQLRSSYDRVADEYEMRFLDELGGKPRDRELLTAFAANVADPVIEIGSGPGQVGAFVRAHGRRVVGLDLSPEMARLASRRLDGAVAADVRSLPCPDESVGGLVAFYSLIHVRRDELVDALAELRRVLRPGGRILFSAHEGAGEIEHDQFLDRPVPFVATLFTIDELVAATETAGFAVTIAERREPYQSESETARLYVEAMRGHARRSTNQPNPSTPR